MLNRVRLVVTSLLVLSFLVGCGYMPASKQARKVVGDKIFVEVTVSLEDPENAVLIKDAARKAVLTRFHSSLVPEERAETTLWVTLTGVSFSPLQYDANGYVIVYRANVGIGVTRQRGKDVEEYNAVGSYDFAIEANAIITDTQRYEAIRSASLKALDSFIAQVGAEGSRL